MSAPITRQRSPWVSMGAAPALPGMADAQAFRRAVGDGTLTAIVGLEQGMWHMSISHKPLGERSAKRYPRWDEIAHARDELLPSDRYFVMHLPPAAAYVAFHDTTFHLWESSS